VAPSGQLLDAALGLAAEIRESAPLAVAAVLEVREATDGLGVQEAFGRVRTGDLPAYRAMLSSQDAEEGPRAFAEGRSPRWQGR
jgi:crotonobetainyl-CoA hydratase